MCIRDRVSKGSANLDDLDFNPLLVQADPGDNPRYCKEKIRNQVPPTLDEKIIKDTRNLIDKGQKIEISYNIKNSKNNKTKGKFRLSHFNELE